MSCPEPRGGRRREFISLLGGAAVAWRLDALGLEIPPSLVRSWETGQGGCYTWIMVKTYWRLIAALRLSRAEMYMLAPVLLGVAALAFFAHQIVGFLGIGLLGVLIGFMAVQVDLDKEGVIGPGILHAQQMMARQNASPSERTAHRSEMQSLARPLLIAKIISAALVILGFGGFFYL
jgi:hypothetical protein